MEAATTSSYADIFLLVALPAVGWLIGQMFPWRRLRHPVGRVSGDGGIDYLLYDVDYTIKRDSSKRTEVELKGHLFELGSGEGKVYVTAEAFSPSPIADEMHRIHNAGAMICSLRPAEKRSKRKDKSGDRPPITVEPPEED